MTHAPLTFAVVVRLRPTPFVAVLGSGLDPMADLAPGTRIFAARSFVDANPWHDPVGGGTAGAIEVVDRLWRPWGPDGGPEVHLLVAKVTGPNGALRRDAFSNAMRWVRSVADDLGIRATPAPAGIAQALADRGVFCLPLAGLQPTARCAPRHAA